MNRRCIGCQPTTGKRRAWLNALVHSIPWYGGQQPPRGFQYSIGRWNRIEFSVDVRGRSPRRATHQPEYGSNGCSQCCNRPAARFSYDAAFQIALRPSPRPSQLRYKSPPPRLPPKGPPRRTERSDIRSAFVALSRYYHSSFSTPSKVSSLPSAKVITPEASASNSTPESVSVYPAPSSTCRVQPESPPGPLSTPSI